MDEREGRKVGERRGGEEGERDVSESLYVLLLQLLYSYMQDDVFVFVSPSLTCRR